MAARGISRFIEQALNRDNNLHCLVVALEYLNINIYPENTSILLEFTLCFVPSSQRRGGYGSSGWHSWSRPCPGEKSEGAPGQSGAIEDGNFGIAGRTGLGAVMVEVPEDTVTRALHGSLGADGTCAVRARAVEASSLLNPTLAGLGYGLGRRVRSAAPESVEPPAQSARRRRIRHPGSRSACLPERRSCVQVDRPVAAASDSRGRRLKPRVSCESGLGGQEPELCSSTRAQGAL